MTGGLSESPTYRLGAGAGLGARGVDEPRVDAAFAGALLGGVPFEGAPVPLVELAMLSTVRLGADFSREPRGRGTLRRR
jgi:hypothetical protein